MNKVIKILLLVAPFVCGGGTSVRAEETYTPPPPGACSVAAILQEAYAAPMTLRECLLYARHHAPDNVINRIEEEKATYDARMSASSLMPEIYLSSNGNISFGRNIDPETNTYDNKKTLYTGFGLSGSLPLFDGLVNLNNLKAARVARQRSRKSREAMEDAISLEVIAAFYNVSYCKVMVRQMEEQLGRDRQNLSAVKYGLETGTKSGADVAEIEALVASDEYELINQRNLLAKAYLTLRTKMGMEPQTGEIALIDGLSSPIDGEAGHRDISSVNPKIAEAQLAVKQSLYNLRSAKGSFCPKISLNGGISTSYYKMIGSGITAPGFSKQWHDNMGQYVGFSVSIPIFTGFYNVNRLKRAQAEYRGQQARLEKTRLEMTRLKEEAALDYNGAVKEWRASQAKAIAEEKAFNAVERRFQLGDASAIDLSTASTRLLTARATLEGKRIQAIVNRITLEYYYGIPLIDEK